MTSDSKQSLEDYALIASSTWSDALDENGIAGVLNGIQQRSGTGRIAGFATTARHVTGPIDTYTKSDFGVARLLETLGPGKVLMVDMGGAEISTFGGLAAIATTARGAAGVVIDGACRDVAEIRASGLWLASRHAVPTTGRRRARLESMGQPVTLGSVRVCEGDVVIGDETGIVVVPSEAVSRVYETAVQMVQHDRRVESELRAGKSFSEAVKTAG
jgi:regulator of RNase E activity RraA